MASSPQSDLLKHVIPQKEVMRKRRTSCCKSSPINSALQCTIEPREVTGDKERKPKWLDSFLRRVFFDPCPEHPIRRNELKKYCIDCDESACQYCISSGAHRQHIVLKIYRHVYKDVVSLHSMAKHIDCSEIQPYKSNKILVIALNPLPHCGPSSTDRATCEICKRRLTDAGLYKYCSISCKVLRKIVKFAEMNLKNAAVIFSSLPLLCSAIIESLLRVLNSSHDHAQADLGKSEDGLSNAGFRSQNSSAQNHFRQLQHVRYA